MTIVGPELTRAINNPPSTPTNPSHRLPLHLTVEECNATADSVYGLVDAVNRATLARVAEPLAPASGPSGGGMKADGTASGSGGEGKASLKLGKADDVTLPWGKTLLAKPLIRLNAATLPPALAELLGRRPPSARSGAGGVESTATVLDGLVAWLDRALGDLVVRRRAEEEAATAAGRAAAEAAAATVVAEEEEGLEGEAVVEGVGEEEKPGPAPGATGAGEVAIADTEQGVPVPAPQLQAQVLSSASSSSSSSSAVVEAEAATNEEEGAAVPKASGAATGEVEVQRTRLVCVLETRAGSGSLGAGGFEAMKVLHQLRLYQIPHLARGLRFVGPSANPSLNAVAFNASAFLMNQR